MYSVYSQNVDKFVCSNLCSNCQLMLKWYHTETMLLYPWWSYNEKYSVYLVFNLFLSQISFCCLRGMNQNNVALVKVPKL